MNNNENRLNHVIMYYYCPTAYSYLFDAFIKVIQPVPNKASGAFSINMHVLECNS